MVTGAPRPWAIRTALCEKGREVTAGDKEIPLKKNLHRCSLQKALKCSTSLRFGETPSWRFGARSVQTPSPPGGGRVGRGPGDATDCYAGPISFHQQWHKQANLRELRRAARPASTRALGKFLTLHV